MNITYGNLAGRWFSQEVIDKILLPLAEEIVNQIGITTFKIWYDAEKDFHCLSFELNERKALVRWYKYPSSYVDGQEVWLICAAGNVSFVRSLATALKRT